MNDKNRIDHYKLGSNGLVDHPNFDKVEIYTIDHAEEKLSNITEKDAFTINRYHVNHYISSIIIYSVVYTSRL